MVQCGKLGVPVGGSLWPEEGSHTHGAELSAALPATLKYRCLVLSVFATQSLVTIKVFMIISISPYLNNDSLLIQSPGESLFQKDVPFCSHPWEIGVYLRPRFLLIFVGG